MLNWHLSVCLLLCSWIDARDPLSRKEATRRRGSCLMRSTSSDIKSPPLNKLSHTRSHEKATSRSSVSHLVISAGRGRVVHSRVWFLAYIFQLVARLSSVSLTLPCQSTPIRLLCLVRPSGGRKNRDAISEIKILTKKNAFSNDIHLQKRSSLYSSCSH